MTKLPSAATKRASTDIRDDSSESSSDLESTKPPEKMSALSDISAGPSSSHSSGSSSSSSRIRSYKDNLSYDPKWKTKYSWMEYCSTLKGMVCTVCKVYGKPPVQAKGAWVTRPVSNWVKATSLLAKHDKSEWHKAAIEKRSMSVNSEAWQRVGANFISQ